jgi:hypothetical protein
MNPIKQISIRLLVAACILLGFSSEKASAQGFFDFFASPKTVQITPPQVITETSGTTITVSNIINVSAYVGIVALDVYSFSNAIPSGLNAPNTNSWSLYTSPNGSNLWTAVTNGWMASQYTKYYTNYYGTTNSQYIISTNTYMAPGTVTTAAVGTQLYSGQYTVPTTNITLTGIMDQSLKGTNWTIGFDADAVGPFLSLQYQVTGSNAIYNVAALLRGRTKQGQY